KAGEAADHLEAALLDRTCDSGELHDRTAGNLPELPRHHIQGSPRGEAENAIAIDELVQDARCCCAESGLRGIVGVHRQLDRNGVLQAVASSEPHREIEVDAGGTDDLEADDAALARFVEHPAYLEPAESRVVR